MSGRSEDPNPLRDEVFSQVFDEHWAAVRHHIEGVVGAEAEVTEIVSEVFLLAWTKLRPARPPSRVWLLRAADRRLGARSGRTSAPHGVFDAVRLGVSGEEGEPDPVGRVAVMRALAVLTPRQRRIIMLTYWDGLTVGEIAELSRTSEFRVRKSLGRARERLRAELGLEGLITGDD